MLSVIVISWGVTTSSVSLNGFGHADMKGKLISFIELDKIKVKKKKINIKGFHS